MVGAVAGTPGTNPTGWFLTASANGISPTIVGTGVEDGIAYVDIQYNGTSTGAGSVSILASLVTAITAATGQSWTGSAYVKVQAGSLVNLTNVLTSVNGRSATGAGIESVNLNYTPTSSRLGIQRQTVSITLANVLTARISHTIFNAAYASGVAIDFTIRIGLPQLEQGAFATSPILTSTATATRAADVASITGTSFSSFYNQTEGTAYWEGSRATTTGFPDRFRFNDGTNANRWFSYWDAASSSSTFEVITGSVSQVQIYGGATTLNVPIKTAFGVAANNTSAVYAATIQGTDTSVTVPTISQVTIGTALTGTIRRLTYWPVRLANPTLQAITQS